MTTLLTSLSQLREYRAFLAGTVALVPTMGALHEGHLTLIRRAREIADHVIVSDFVNPLQFGPGEDFEKYPRDIPGDLSLVEGVADALFAPSVDEMYPNPEPYRVTVGTIGTVLEGAFRPGHFDGVATVVTKLFTLVHPDVAVFGEKDAQQLAIVQRLVEDLNLPVRIEPMPIVREESGLARSSRNAYLSDAARHGEALVLSRVVERARRCTSARELLDVVNAREDATEWNYRVAVDPATLEPITEAFAGEALVLLAAEVEGVRLLDNTRVTVKG